MPKGICLNTGRTHFKKGCISLMKGKKHSEEAKQKMSFAHKGKILSKEHSKNIGIALKGKERPLFSEEVKKKMSLAHMGKYLGKDNPAWKGGRYKTTKGYIYVSKPSHPFCNKMGYIAKHRLIIEKYLRRYLTPKEVSHHLGKKDDNRFKMLMAFISHSAHRRFEMGGKVKPSDIIFDGRKL